MTSSRETVLCQYRYDPLDRLIGHALPDIPERQRFYCKSRLTTEIQGAMRYSIVQHGDQLLAQQRRAGNAPDTTLLATDQQRSVLQAFKADHSSPPIAYSPYGHRANENGLLSLLGFTGERLDPVTGHYLLGNGYRAFNPVLMRFNSPDSLSPFRKGGLNSYAYCLGDPLNLIDLDGHAPLPIPKFAASWIKSFDIPQPATINTATSAIYTPALRSSRPSVPKDLSMNAPTRSVPGREKPHTNFDTLPNSQALGRRSSLPTTRTNPISESYEPAGYHGSLTSNAKSLQDGVKQQPIGKGDGFYTSFNRNAALMAPPDKADKTAFGVWVKNYSAMMPGRDYTTGAWASAPMIIFKAHTYPSIRVDVIRGQFKRVKPRSHEAPF